MFPFLGKKNTANRRIFFGLFRAAIAVAWIAAGPVIFSGCSDGRLRVVEVYDGDTVKLSNGEKVRLLGIDSPEAHDSDKLFRQARRVGMPIERIKTVGEKAHTFVRDRLKGRFVELEFDEETRDRYGRLLAYVYVRVHEKGDLRITPVSGHVVNRGGEDYYFVNATILAEGYAVPLNIEPNSRYRELFERLSGEAEQSNRGLWKEEDFRTIFRDEQKVH